MGKPSKQVGPKLTNETRVHYAPEATQGKETETSGYTTWFTAGGAIRIGHYDVNDDVITQKL